MHLKKIFYESFYIMKIARLLILFLICLGAFSAEAQKKKSTKTTAKKTAVHKSKTPAQKPKVDKPIPIADKAQVNIGENDKKIKDIVAFLEYVLNLLGSNTTATRDKDVLITESYSKIFRDTKVQIEDDLDEDREVITNKDVVAYLKDVDFFFNDVRFEFVIEGIEEGKSGGNTFYKVSTKRNLKGTTSDGKPVNKTVARYIEINYNPADQDLKIVSVYTHEFNEKTALTNWWKELSYEWQAIFERKVNVKDSVTLIDLKNITAIDTLDLSNNKYLREIGPLSQLISLKSLKLSNVHIDDISPIRNLTALTDLDISHTKVRDLSPLKYASNVVKLKVSHTEVKDISVVQKMPSLQHLDIAHTKITDFSPISNLSQVVNLNVEHTPLNDLHTIERLNQLTELNISATGIENLNSIKLFTKLTVLDIDSTRITAVTALSSLENLKILHANYTLISDLMPLQKLPHLERVYCDKTRITKDLADVFMAAKPTSLVVYNSEDLKTWWADLPPAWQDVLLKSANAQSTTRVVQTPSKEELAIITNLDSINISSNNRINDIASLKRLHKLRVINLSKTNIKDLSPIKDHKEITHLDISETDINNLSALSQFSKLKVLHADRSKVENIESLYGIASLEKLYVDNTSINDINAQEFLEKDPACLIIYKTIHLNRWWRTISPRWKEVFKKQMRDTSSTRENLHQLIEQQTLQFKDVNVNDLSGLSEFVRLKELDFSGTSIQNISYMENLKGLTSLHGTNSPLQKLDALAKFTALEELDISNTPIDDLKVMGGLKNLRRLNCSGTQVKRLNALEGLGLLESIDCSNTTVGNLTPIYHMPLKTLKCYNTKVSKREVDDFKKNNPTCEVVYYR